MNRFRLVNKKTIAILIFSLIFTSVYSNLCAEEKYYPYPIVFVHGFNTEGKDPLDIWSWPVACLRAYFTNQELEDTYFGESLEDHVLLCDYTSISNYAKLSSEDLIPYVAKDQLLNTIEEALSKQPDDQRKVIIVAHSMGGLVVRSFLKQFPFYENEGKIEKVVFLGTPHLGSPTASSIVLIKRLIPELEILEKRYRMSAMDILFSSFSSKSRAARDFHDKVGAILFLHKQFVEFEGGGVGGFRLLNVKAVIGNYKEYLPHNHEENQKVAVTQLVVPANIFNTRSFMGIDPLLGMTIIGPEIAQSNYTENQTFLSSDNLSTPANFNTIKGTGGMSGPIGNLSKFIMTLCGNNFSGFPTDNSLDDLASGDGVVPLVSQTALEGEIYTTTKWHSKETSDYKTILKAIEDKPIIERIYAIAVDESERKEDMKYYIVVKVKDYLLADIEIAEMTLSGAPVDCKEFYNPDDKTYKPYFKFKKEFLKERPDPNAPVTDIEGNPKCLELLPGEFYVKATMAAGYTYELKLKIKNPAEEFAGDGSFTDEVTVHFSRPVIKDLFFANGSGDEIRHDPYLDWSIDVPIYDEDKHEEAPDWRKNDGTLETFTIEDKLFQDMKVSIRVFGGSNLYWPKPPIDFIPYKNPLRTLIDNETVTLDESEDGYSKEFVDNDILNTVWNGKDDNGNNVAGYCDISERWYWYALQIFVQPLSDDPYIYPHNDPPVLKQLLPATNWDTQKWDLICADPTFIQHSREVKYDFFSKKARDNLKLKLNKKRLAQRKAFESANYELASRLKEINGSERTIAKLENRPLREKQKPSILAVIADEF
ncbi:MAG: hypothetical protein KAJ66_04735 [Candidatus Omnitrophica bacterium]|nr:hypothetical protein [Candidatus Omnitrophota bacterium]